MKWKEFFASTLPRSRKSRRKSTKHADCPEQTGALSSPETDDATLHNQKLRSDISNGNKKKKRSLSSSKVNEQLTQIAYNRQLVSPDFIYVNDNQRGNYTNPYGHQTLCKSYSNASESGFEDGFDHSNHGLCDSNTDSKWCCGTLEGQHAAQADLLPSLNHTFPRERTRIKTNPWVTSHSKAMTSSLHSEVGERAPLDTTVIPPYLKDYQNNEILTPLSPNRNCNNGNYKSTTDSESSDTDWFGHSERLMPRQYSYERNSNDEPVDYQGKENSRCESFDSDQTGVLKGGDLVINLNTGDIFVKPKPKPVFSTINFKYEDDLEATLERDSGGRKKRSRRHREETRVLTGNLDSCKDISKAKAQNRDVHMDFSEDTPGSGERDADTCGRDSGTLTREASDVWTYETSDTKSFRKRGLLQRETNEEVIEHEMNRTLTHAPHNSVIYRVVDRRRTKSKTECHGTNDMLFDSMYHRDCADSAYDSSTLSSLAGSSFHGQLSSLERTDELAKSDFRPMTLPGIRSRSTRSKPSREDAKRSLEQIHSSLKDKVEQLRAEKRIVDAKVKQAREEEELKREEKAKIQKEVSSLRKQVLLRTLQELKSNLEDQNCRLQEAYDDVLDMQWINAKLRRMRNTTI